MGGHTFLPYMDNVSSALCLEPASTPNPSSRNKRKKKANGTDIGTVAFYLSPQSLICSSMNTSNIRITMTGRTSSSFPAPALRSQSQSQNLLQMTVRAFTSLFDIFVMSLHPSSLRTANPATELSEWQYTCYWRMISNTDFTIDAAMMARILPKDPELETLDETHHTWHVKNWRTLDRKEHGPAFQCGGSPW